MSKLKFLNNNHNSQAHIVEMLRDYYNHDTSVGDVTKLLLQSLGRNWDRRLRVQGYKDDTSRAYKVSISTDNFIIGILALDEISSIYSISSIS